MANDQLECLVDSADYKYVSGKKKKEVPSPQLCS